MDLSLCLVATELFDWGRHGGIGMATRTIGVGLVDRGVNVSVVVPRGTLQAPVEELDGMTVHGFPIWRYPLTGSLYRRVDADIYHSEGLSWGSVLALNSVPERRHIVTFQNPRTREEWGALYRFYPLRRRLFNALYWDRLVEVVGRMDAVYCQSRDMIPKAKEMYHLADDPGFLPNPVDVPNKIPRKSGEPTVCFLGRFDGEKRPELFLELAERFPDVRFVAMGRANDESRDRALRRRYGGSTNVEMPGFLSGEIKNRILEEAWILVNTSVSEGFPVSFLEAAAHGCAILSPHDPEGFSSRFGHHVGDGGLDAGLRFLLDSGRWKRKGEEGYAYVSEFHEKGRVIDMHMEVYEGLMGA
jgi:glycosyltransferase involved in cell wall biosynthesis